MSRIKSSKWSPDPYFEQDQSQKLLSYHNSRRFCEIAWKLRVIPLMVKQTDRY